MTPTDREQQARACLEASPMSIATTEEPECVEALVTLLADTERATLDRVMKRFAATAGLVQWCKQQLKEIPS